MKLPRASLTSGFTLIELLVVILIIVILMACLMPIYGKVQLKSRREATQATIMALRALLLATEKGAADVRGTAEVIVNGKPAGKIILTPENNDLLHQFASHPFLIAGSAGKQSMIFLRNVSPDADRIQPVQPGFLAAPAASITQYPALADNEDVRDELFVTQVVFGVTPVEVQKVCRGGYHRQIFLDLEAQALKHAEFIEKFPFKTKHSFFRGHSSFAFLHCCAPG